MKHSKLIVLLAGSTMLLAGAAAQAQPQGGPGGYGGHHGGGRGGPGHAMMMLRAADANGDNSITQAEVDTLQAEMFAWMDRNEDGFLDDADRSPMHARMQAIRAEQGGMAGGRGARRGDRGPGGGAGMTQADADGDGRVSRAEFLGREDRMFGMLDADENGVVTPEELDAAAERRQDRRFWWRN